MAQKSNFSLWFSFMWVNKYIQIFFVASVLLVLEIIHRAALQGMVEDCRNSGDRLGLAMCLMGISIPGAIMIVTAIFGFWKSWVDYKKYL